MPSSLPRTSTPTRRRPSLRGSSIPWWVTVRHHPARGLVHGRHWPTRGLLGEWRAAASGPRDEGPDAADRGAGDRATGGYGRDRPGRARPARATATVVPTRYSRLPPNASATPWPSSPK